MDEAISQANKKYEYVMSDKEALHYAQMRERAIIGYNSDIAEAEKKGENKKAIEIAKSLLDILDVDTIAKKTKLTIDEVTKLKNSKNYRSK